MEVIPTPSLGERITKAWNAFRNKDPTENQSFYYGQASNFRPDGKRTRQFSQRSIVSPILNRISVDAATIDIHHVKLDENKYYKEDIEDSLNEVLTVEANIDQTARAFR